MLQDFVSIVGGLVVLVLGAEWMVRGSSRLALALGIAPLVVGLTVVAFGTSAPELAVSVTSAYAGSNDIAVANAVGSNIINILLILGASALVTPLVVHHQLVRLDVPIMIGMSLLLFVLGADGRLGLWDSGLLAALIVAYTAFVVKEARREKDPTVIAEYGGDLEATNGSGSPVLNGLLVLAGFAGLVIGSHFFVEGAIDVARLLGVSEVVIGLTLVAGGTSLPELATSVVAAFRGERDIAIGNVVGSNIFNMGSVLGFSGLASVGSLTVAPNLFAVDIPFMIAVSLLCLPFFRTGYELSRANGAVFVGVYLVYLVYLYLQATKNPALATLHLVVFEVLLPVLIIGTVVVIVGSLRAEKKSD